jgi:hypothetical protein
LKEAIEGRVRHTYIPERLKPVEEYLATQRRFRHLFHPERQDAVLARIQGEVEAYWEEVKRQERSGVVSGSKPAAANPTTRRPPSSTGMGSW